MPSQFETDLAKALSNIPVNLPDNVLTTSSKVVTSVNGKTGDVILEVTGGVTSVNGQTGDVTIPLNYLPLGGGTLTGSLSMGNNSITLGSKNLSPSGSNISYGGNRLAYAYEIPSVPPRPDSYITATWSSGTSWYRVWSDGFIEQGGYDACPSRGTKAVTFMKSYARSPVVVVSGLKWTGGTNNAAAVACNSISTSNFVALQPDEAAGNHWTEFVWHASGY